VGIVGPLEDYSDLDPNSGCFVAALVARMLNGIFGDIFYIEAALTQSKIKTASSPNCIKGAAQAKMFIKGDTPLFLTAMIGAHAISIEEM
jgi:hypothetical protein